MEILFGKPVAEHIAHRTKKKLRRASARPKLVAVLANDREESRVYLRKKQEAAATVGIDFLLDVIPSDERTTPEIVRRVHVFNNDPSVHGIIVQLPLTDGVEQRAVLGAINPAKDVDGLHALNVGRVFTREGCFPAATAQAVIEILDHYRISISGQHIVVVGRSRLIGMPLAGLLLARDATVTVCHSKTRDLAEHTERADIIVAAAGVPGLVTRDMVQDDVILIDTGWSSVNGKARGDIHRNARTRCRAYTPVPGGIGPVTVAVLIENTAKAFFASKQVASKHFVFHA